MIRLFQVYILHVVYEHRSSNITHSGSRRRPDSQDPQVEVSAQVSFEALMIDREQIKMPLCVARSSGRHGEPDLIKNWSKRRPLRG
jgi:hypothetical protein